MEAFVSLNTSIKDHGQTSERYAKFCLFMGSYIGGVVLIGGLMNSIVILGMLRFYKCIDVSSVLVISQAFCDVSCPLFAYPMSATSSFNCAWLYGYYGCQYYGFFTSFAGYASMLNLTLLSVERYITLNFPLKREILLSKTNMALALFAVYFSAAVWAIVPWFKISAYVMEGVGTMCSVKWHSGESSTFWYNLLLTLGVYVVPMIIIAFCYAKFLREIYMLSSRASALQNPSVSAETRDIEKQQTILVLLMVTGYNLAWFPYSLVCFISIVGYPHLVSPVAASLPAVFAKTSNVANPILYCLLNKRFRRALCSNSQVSPELDSM